MKVLLVLCVASQALGQTDLTAKPETVKVDFEETIVACARAGAGAASTNSPLVAKIQAAFDNCRQYEKQPKGKSLLNRQSKGKKGKKGNKGKKGKSKGKGKGKGGKGSKKCFTVDELTDKIQSKSISKHKAIFIHHIMYISSNFQKIVFIRGCMLIFKVWLV